MPKYKYLMQDIYEILRKNGLDGLLDTRASLAKSLDLASIEEKTEISNSIELMDREIFQKVQRNGDLYILYSAVTDSPFIECKNTEFAFYVYLFSSKELAEDYSKQLKAGGFATKIRQIVAGKKRPEYYQQLMLNGCIYLVLNKGPHEYTLSIEQLTEIPQYDGFAGLDFPLINCRLNALLNYYSELSKARKMTKEFEQEVFKILGKAHFVAPIIETGTSDTIDHVQILFNYILMEQDDEGIKKNVMPIFTDYVAMDEWIKRQSNELPYKGIILSFVGLFDILNQYQIKEFVVNVDTLGLVLTGEIMTQIGDAHSDSV